MQLWLCVEQVQDHGKTSTCGWSTATPSATGGPRPRPQCPAHGGMTPFAPSDNIPPEMGKPPR